MALLPIRFEEGREPQIKGQDGDCALFVGIHDELDGTEFVSFKLLNYDTKLTDTKLSPVHPLFSHAYLRDQAAKMTQQGTPLVHQGLEPQEALIKFKEFLSPWFEMKDGDLLFLLGRISAGISMRYGHVSLHRLREQEGVYALRIKGPDET